MEIIDPFTGDVLADGEEGEMVVTTLTREGLPLIRFRTRDITSVVSRDRCDCGRTHLRIARITGRNDDMIKIKGVNFFPRQIESLLLKEPGTGNDYLIEIDRIEGGDHLKVTVEVDDPGDGSMADKLNSILKNFLGFGADVVIVSLGGIEKAPGKAVRVVDRRVG
jgi:phenylacetate-CoA ligase